MLIIAQGKTQLVILQNVTKFFADDRNRVKVDCIDGSGCMLATYASTEQAQEALRQLAKAVILNADTFIFPSCDEIAARLQQQQRAWHHATGKKTKGHGGS